MQAFGQAVPAEDPYGVGGEEARARPGLNVRAVGALQDDAVDPAPVEEIAEHQPGRSGAEDDHISRVFGCSNCLTFRHKGGS